MYVKYLSKADAYQVLAGAKEMLTVSVTRSLPNISMLRLKCVLKLCDMRQHSRNNGLLSPR